MEKLCPTSTMYQCRLAFICCVIGGFIACVTSKNVEKRQLGPIFSNEEPESLMSTAQIIQHFGYPVENHIVTTDDGYILEIQRIPRGRRPSRGPRTPVIVQHGILCSSADSVINFPRQSIGFVLADAGYDVWLTNVRGNTYGRNHTRYNPDRDDAFWQFSFDQMGEYDVPALIDYVLNTTRYRTLYYVGHSMGSTMALAMLSTKTEYNKKIQRFLAVAPVATLNYAPTLLRYLVPFADNLVRVGEIFGVPEFLPSNKLFSGNEFFDLLAPHCDGLANLFCESAFFLICGVNPDELNSTRMDVYVHHTPAGTSSWTINHYAQIIKHREFKKCDWGRTRNIELYRQETPPAYNLSKITVETVIFWAANDWLADPWDVANLRSRLSNVRGTFRIGDLSWAHLDFFWGINAGRFFLPRLIQQMPKF